MVITWDKTPKDDSYPFQAVSTASQAPGGTVLGAASGSKYWHNIHAALLYWRKLTSNSYLLSVLEHGIRPVLTGRPCFHKRYSRALSPEQALWWQNVERVRLMHTGAI